MQKEKIYHIYSNENIIAHSLTFDELCDKINNEEINLENVEILQLSPPQYSEAYSEASY
jgi:hypothetical protein